MMKLPVSLQNGVELVWQKCCAIESCDDRRFSFIDIGIIRCQGKYGLIHIPNEDELDDSIPLLTCTFDALHLLYHPLNKSYFVGFKEGKCGLYAMTAHSYQHAEDYYFVDCTELAKPEHDSISWNGDSIITLHQGDYRQDYCLRTHTLSTPYENSW